VPQVYLSLGSNIEPEKHLRAAISELRNHFGHVDISPVYRCRAVGFEGPDFLNLAAGFQTDLPVENLNEWLHRLEENHGRRRDVPRFSNRTLDIDIVLYGQLVTAGEGNLQLPRPELKHAFVLKPLVDIAPNAIHPLLSKTLVELWEEFPKEQELLFSEPLNF